MEIAVELALLLVEVAEVLVPRLVPDVLGDVLKHAMDVIPIAVEVVVINVQLAPVVLEDVVDVILVVQAALLVARMNVVDAAVVQEVAVQRAQDVILLVKPVAQMLVQQHALRLVNKTAMLLVAIVAKE